MRTDKDIAFKLRREGKTYREIEKELGISRSTLCDWFRNEEWSYHIKKSNNEIHIRLSTERLAKLHQARKIILEKKYKDVEIEAEREFEIYKNDPLFMAGLMLYVGEGDKRTKNVIRLANTEFFVHRVFLKFLEKFTKTSMDRIRFSVLLYPDLDPEYCKQKWSDELRIPLTNFHKPVVILGRSKVRRLHFGVGSTIISDSFLKRKILFWIDKGVETLCNNAVIV
jgi:hypothetical protein